MRQCSALLFEGHGILHSRDHRRAADVVSIRSNGEREDFCTILDAGRSNKIQAAAMMPLHGCHAPRNRGNRRRARRKIVAMHVVHITIAVIVDSMATPWILPDVRSGSGTVMM